MNIIAQGEFRYQYVNRSYLVQHVLTSGNCPTACWTISASLQASANTRIVDWLATLAINTAIKPYNDVHGTHRTASLFCADPG